MPAGELSIMSTEYALNVARYHLDKAQSKGVEQYWLAVCKSLKATIANNKKAT